MKNWTVSQIRAPYNEVMERNDTGPLPPKEAVRLAREAAKDAKIPADSPIEVQIDPKSYTVTFVERLKRRMPASGCYLKVNIDKETRKTELLGSY